MWSFIKSCRGLRTWIDTSRYEPFPMQETDKPPSTRKGKQVNITVQTPKGNAVEIAIVQSEIAGWWDAMDEAKEREEIMSHKHFCLRCFDILAEGEFDCESDTDHDFELCANCQQQDIQRPPCPWYVLYFEDGSIRLAERDLSPRGEDLKEFAGPYATEQEAREFEPRAN